MPTQKRRKARSNASGNNGHATGRPVDSDEAIAALTQGNRRFSEWSHLPSALQALPGRGEQPQSNIRSTADFPEHSPFAVVVGCSDARVPVEYLFGQSVNDLYVVRVAGNVLGDECLGSVQYALTELAHSVKAIVVLGHLGCDTVTAAVDSFIESECQTASHPSPCLDAIISRIVPALKLARSGVEQVSGELDFSVPCHRRTLVHASTWMNAAWAAYELGLMATAAGADHMQVLFGVYDINSHRVHAPRILMENSKPVTELGFSSGPRTEEELKQLSIAVAQHVIFGVAA